MGNTKEFQNMVLRIIDTLYKRTVGKNLDRFSLAERVTVIVDGKKVK